MERHKYVKIKEYNSIIIFPEIINHSDFKGFGVISAGFCSIDEVKKVVTCFGESIGLGIESMPKEDTIKATGQFFGIDAMLKIL